MPARKPARLKFRPLLSETLPYEVPIIFSNAQMYASACEKIVDVGLKRALDLTAFSRSGWTISYDYKISKGRSSTRSLSVMHPHVQLDACLFYERYERTILDLCSKSNFSLRYPSDVSSSYLRVAGGDFDAGDGGMSADTAEGDVAIQAEVDAPMVGSYFSYARYTNVGRFIDSAEFVRLEKRFSQLAKIDVSRCFASIYTHSIAWAVKGRVLSKRNAQKHSFEGTFDRIMMDSNYNETNGILVGPELSRIFAEIILQEVDKEVAGELNLANLRENWDYAIRRYVDDYYIFTSDEKIRDKIIRLMSDRLSSYKMHVNEDKSEVLSRPFISDISIARKEIKDQFRNIGIAVDGIRTGENGLAARRAARVIKSDIEELRIIAQRNRVDMSELSGWILGFIKRMIGRITRRYNDELLIDCEDGVAEIVAALIRLTFYVCALDVRVRPTYSLAEIFVQAIEVEGLLSESCRDVIRHALTEEFLSLVKSTASAGSGLGDRTDPVEVCNLLICGSHFLGKSFVQSSDVALAIRKLSQESLTYFRYISAKFCMLKDTELFKADLELLNSVVKLHLESSTNRIERDCMHYMLFADYLSAPDVPVSDKRAVYSTHTSQNISARVMNLLGPRLRFADWTGRSLETLLQRKELRPLYE